jgi:hypothetical protein
VPLWVLCHEYRRSTRRCVTVREMKEGPFEVGNQVLISSHRKLLSSKAMVVNVAEKSERDFGRCGGSSPLRSIPTRDQRDRSDLPRINPAIQLIG